MIEFRLIPGCKSHYAGDDGNLYRQHPKTGKYVVLKTSICKRTGYKKASFMENRKRFMNSAHWFVALCFLGERANSKQQVRHDDGDRLNNRPGNLLWGSPKQNAYDKVRHGTMLQGDAHPSSKLTERKVRTIKVLVLSGYSTRELARKYRMSKSAISAINRGVSWKHVS